MNKERAAEREYILEMICDHCHLTYVIKNQEKMTAKCDACPIGARITSIMKKLDKYESDEESGQLIRLPAPIGKTVFVLTETEDKSVIEELQLAGYASANGKESYFYYEPSLDCIVEIEKQSCFATWLQAAAYAKYKQMLKDMAELTGGK